MEYDKKEYIDENSLIYSNDNKLLYPPNVRTGCRISSQIQVLLMSTKI